ncbi:hypothetical protein [Actinokineospora sp. HUAS TT18]|uniref:hypothetical protein n=1 Tax=Actinokineospora sp. HUAS TT18 TaxID=3447451 RepID=UPI003F51BA20
MSLARPGIRIFAVIAALVLSVTACSKEQSGTDATQAADIGRQIVIRSAGSPTLATLWLDSVKPVECTEPGSLKPNNGHYLAATIVLQTTQDYQPNQGWWMSATDFATKDGEGKVTGRGIFTSCLPTHRYLPDDFYLADAGYYGVVLIDSSSEHGTLEYRPHNMPDDVPGWHWEY